MMLGKLTGTDTDCLCRCRGYRGQRTAQVAVDVALVSDTAGGASDATSGGRLVVRADQGGRLE